MEFWGDINRYSIFSDKEQLKYFMSNHASCMPKTHVHLLARTNGVARYGPSNLLFVGVASDLNINIKHST